MSGTTTRWLLFHMRSDHSSVADRAPVMVLGIFSLVRWQGFSYLHVSWESEADLTRCVGAPAKVSS